MFACYFSHLSEFVGVRGGMVAPGGGTATSGSGDTSSDSDHEQLIRHGSGACGTGSIICTVMVMS